MSAIGRETIAFHASDERPVVRQCPQSESSAEHRKAPRAAQGQQESCDRLEAQADAHDRMVALEVHLVEDVANRGVVRLRFDIGAREDRVTVLCLDEDEIVHLVLVA